MKTFSKLYLLAATALGLTACNSDQDYLDAFQSDPDAVRLSVQIGGGNEAELVTKVNTFAGDDAASAFDAGDEISVATDDQTAVVYKLDKDKGWQPSADGQYLIWKTEPMNFQAFYPAGGKNDASMETFTQPAKFNTEADLKAADYMTFSGEKNRPTGNDALTLQMTRKMARVIFNVKDKTGNQYGTFTASSITMSINSTGYSANGVVSGSMTVKTFMNNNKQFYALVTPTTAENKEFLTIEGKADGEDVTLTITGIPSLDAGKSYTYNLTIGKDKATVASVEVENWNTDIIPGGVAEEVTKSYPIIDPVNHIIETNKEDQFTTAQIDEALGENGTDLKIIGPITSKAKADDYTDLYSQLSLKVANLDLSAAQVSTALPGNAFYVANSKLASIILPDDVTALPAGAFMGCSNLTKITCKGDIKTIGCGAFKGIATPSTLFLTANTGCPTFTDSEGGTSSTIEINNFANYVYTGQFVVVYVKDKNVRDQFLENTTWRDGLGLLDKGSTPQTAIGIPAKVDASTHTLTLYEGGAFEDDDLATALGDGTDLKVVGEFPTSTHFSNKLVTVKNLDLSGTTMISVPQAAFCPSTTQLLNESVLETVILPATATEIGLQAFCYCPKLKTVTCLGAITSIGNFAFATYAEGTLTINLKANTSTPIPTLGSSVFNDGSSNTSMKTVVMVNDAVTREAFKADETDGGWKSWLSKGVTVASPAEVDATNHIITTYAEGQLTTALIESACTSGNLTIAGPMNSADWNALVNSDSDILLTSLNLKDVTMSADLASSLTFNSFKMIQGVTLPSSLTAIPASCFKQCIKLISVTCPGILTEIGNEAFSGCSELTSLNLSEATYTEAPKLGTGVFTSTNKPTVYVNSSSIEVIAGSSSDWLKLSNDGFIGLHFE